MEPLNQDRSPSIVYNRICKGKKDKEDEKGESSWKIIKITKQPVLRN